MATLTIKATYSLDPETTKSIEEMARRWNVSKSEVLRRAIRTVAGQSVIEADPVRALERLQKSLSLSAESARRWEKRTRSERRTSSQRLGGRGR